MKEIDKLEDIEDSFPYKDILNYQYHKSLRYPHQSRISRAGQFAPFAALSGYDDQVSDALRFVLKRIELGEQEKDELDKIISTIKINDKLKITYFIKDKSKDGGSYLTVSKIFKKIDYLKRIMVFNDKSIISLNDIVKIEKINIQDNDNLL